MATLTCIFLLIVIPLSCVESISPKFIRSDSIKQCVGSAVKALNGLVEPLMKVNSYHVHGILMCGGKVTNNKETQMELIIETRGTYKTEPVPIDDDGSYSVCVETITPLKAWLQIQTSCPDKVRKALERYPLPTKFELMGHYKEIDLKSLNIEGPVISFA